MILYLLSTQVGHCEKVKEWILRADPIWPNVVILLILVAMSIVVHYCDVGYCVGQFRHVQRFAIQSADFPAWLVLHQFFFILTQFVQLLQERAVPFGLYHGFHGQQSVVLLNNKFPGSKAP